MITNLQIISKLEDEVSELQKCQTLKLDNHSLMQHVIPLNTSKTGTSRQVAHRSSVPSSRSENRVLSSQATIPTDMSYLLLNNPALFPTFATNATHNNPSIPFDNMMLPIHFQEYYPVSNFAVQPGPHKRKLINPEMSMPNSTGGNSRRKQSSHHRHASELIAPLDAKDRGYYPVSSIIKLEDLPFSSYENYLSSPRISSGSVPSGDIKDSSVGLMRRDHQADDDLHNRHNMSSVVNDLLVLGRSTSNLNLSLANNTSDTRYMEPVKNCFEHLDSPRLAQMEYKPVNPLYHTGFDTSNHGRFNNVKSNGRQYVLLNGHNNDSLVSETSYLADSSHGSTFTLQEIMAACPSEMTSSIAQALHRLQTTKNQKQSQSPSSDLCTSDETDGCSSSSSSSYSCYIINDVSLSESDGAEKDKILDSRSKGAPVQWRKVESLTSFVSSGSSSRNSTKDSRSVLPKSPTIPLASTSSYASNPSKANLLTSMVSIKPMVAASLAPNIHVGDDGVLRLYSSEAVTSLKGEEVSTVSMTKEALVAKLLGDR